MLGNTNAVIVQGGGGDVVMAVNNTGGEIVKGTKAWLNKHNLSENEAYQTFNKNNGSNAQLIHFDTDNNVLATFNQYRNKYVYNTVSKNWQNSVLESGTSAAMFCRILSGYFVGYSSSYLNNNNKSYIINEASEFEVPGWYLGQGLMIAYVASGQAALKKFDPATGIAGDTIYTFTVEGSYVTAAFLSGNTLFFSSVGNDYYFYDIAGWDNTYFEFTPQLLGSGVFAGLYTNMPVTFATGLEVGDYFILTQKLAGTTGKNLIIYKIGAGYTIAEADDLQTDLAGLVGLPARIQYYNDTGYLTVGTADNVYLFKFENGAFVNQNLTLTFPTDYVKLENYCWLMFISGDLTSAALCYNDGASTQKLSLYKLVTSSDDWYADTFGMASSLSLTGFATGNSEGGKYEFATVEG